MRLPSFLRPKNKPPTSTGDDLSIDEKRNAPSLDDIASEVKVVDVSDVDKHSEVLQQIDATAETPLDLNKVKGGAAEALEENSTKDSDGSSRQAGKSSKWNAWRNKRQKASVAEGATSSEAAEVPKAKNLPIRVVIGYLPEVSERDAKEYALGLADKHFEQMSLVYFEALPFAQGFAYEIHEGGSGKTFLPELIAYFESLGEFDATAQNSVVIKTATRLVEVQRTREGLATVILPESSEVEPTSWLRGTKNMTPAVSKNTAFAYTGFGLFASGMVALLLCGAVFRLQPFAAEQAPKPKVVSVDELPRTQWDMIQNVPEDSYVSALRFKEGKWQAPELQKIGENPNQPPPDTGQPAPTVAPVPERKN